jgi:hypothetical protein
MIKLPVLAIVREAYAFLWRQRRVFWALAVPGVIVVAIVGAVLVWIMSTIVSAGGTGGANIDVLRRGPIILVLLIYAVIYGAIAILYSVAWHRAYLLPGQSTTVGGAYRWHMRQTRFFFNYLKIFGTVIPFMLIAGVVIGMITAPLATHWAIAVIQIAYIVVGGWIFARLSMLFPATAVDRHMKYAEGWRLTQGNGWRLLGIIVLVAIPMWVIALPVNFAIAKFAFEAGLFGSPTVSLLRMLIYHFLGFVGIAVGVTALSISYKRLTDV